MTQNRPGTDNGWKITQITAAPPGWWARFIDRETPGDSWVAPVACWVVAEDEDQHQRVLGVSPTDDLLWPMGDPITQPVNYFYDPAFNPGIGNTSGTSDPGPTGR